jgi:enamine deaminase RidA (YjgF/YER057c/UK114 family)
MSKAKVHLYNPLQLMKPTGYSHAAVGEGRIVAVAGQIGTDADGKLVAPDIVGQFRQAIQNLHTALQPTGAIPDAVIKLNIYVTDLDAYRSSLKEIGEAYREVFRYHYPPMTCVQVAGLFDEGVLVEIEAWAVV